MISNLFWPLVMLFIGLGLLVLELVVPSAGVLGILACVTLLAAVTVGFASAGLTGGTLFMTLTVILIPLVLTVALRWWQKSAIGRRLLMEPPDEAEVLPAGRLVAKDWVGRKGWALSAMLPAGAVRIDDRTLDAITEGLSIEKDDPIVVVAIRDNRLVVRLDDQPVRPESRETSLAMPLETSAALSQETVLEEGEGVLPAPTDLAADRSSSVSVPFSASQPAAGKAPRSNDELRRPDVDLEVPDPFDDSLP